MKVVRRTRWLEIFIASIATVILLVLRRLQVPTVLFESYTLLDRKSRDSEGITFGPDNSYYLLAKNIDAIGCCPLISILHTIVDVRRLSIKVSTKIYDHRCPVSSFIFSPIQITQKLGEKSGLYGQERERQSRAPVLRKRLNVFPGGLHFAFNPGTTLAYFVVSGAQNTRKTKDNALRYLYTMLVVKMRRKKRGGWECSKVERGEWR